MISVSGGRVNSVGATPMAASGQISGRRVASCENHPNGLSMRSQRIARRRIDRNLQDKPIASDPHAMRDSSASMNRFSSTTSSWSERRNPYCGFSPDGATSIRPAGRKPWKTARPGRTVSGTEFLTLCVARSCNWRWMRERQLVPGKGNSAAKRRSSSRGCGRPRLPGRYARFYAGLQN
jgi:hypothetical protein